MKTTVLHGSPNKSGDSDTLVKQFLTGLGQIGNTKHFYLNELDIRPCQGCLHCAKPPDHNCKIEDDMQLIYQAYKEADLIVYATPMYWGYMTAQMKTAQDRMEALAWKGYENKTLVIIITYHHHYESTKGFFERIAPHFNLNCYYLICRTWDPESRQSIPINECVDELQAALNLGKKLGEMK